MKKLTLLIFTMIMGQLMLSAQTSCPTPPPPGSDCSNCPRINVLVDPDCFGCDTFKFIWGYQYPHCNGTFGAGFVIPGYTPVPSNPWVAPCLQFCDDPCKCPVSFQLLDPNTGTLVEPWGPVTTWSTTHITYYNITVCGSNNAQVDITYSGGIWTFHFSCP